MVRKSNFDFNLQRLRNDFFEKTKGLEGRFKTAAACKVFEEHKDFISSLSAEEALVVEHSLGFWGEPKKRPAVNVVITCDDDDLLP